MHHTAVGQRDWVIFTAIDTVQYFSVLHRLTQRLCTWKWTQFKQTFSGLSVL